VENSERT